MFSWFRDRLFGSPRSGKWPRVRKEHLEREPLCVACGRRKDIEVHHVVPFHEDPSLELEPSNLISVCRDPCHYVFGHLLNWKKSNPMVREDCERYRQRMKNFGSVADE